MKQCPVCNKWMIRTGDVYRCYPCSIQIISEPKKYDNSTIYFIRKAVTSVIDGKEIKEFVKVPVCRNCNTELIKTEERTEEDIYECPGCGRKDIMIENFV